MGSVDIKGTELFYEERGTGGAILLIHGTGSNSDVWAGAWTLWPASIA